MVADQGNVVKKAWKKKGSHSKKLMKGGGRDL